MIELLDRKSILNLNKTFASFILEVQDAKYNPIHNPNEPGEMYVDDSEKPRYVSQEECDKWNKEEQMEFDQNRDKVETEPIKFIEERVFTFSEAEIDQYLNNLGNGLENLNKQLDWQSTIFLLDYPTPWLSQDNDYEPVKKALDYLKSIGVTDDFTGGFKANGQELKELTMNLFWIVRCNASLPDCYFSGIEKGFVGDVCKHGNIHFHFYSDTDRQEILNETKEIGLKAIEGIHCYDSFSETSKIDGRQIIV